MESPKKKFYSGLILTDVRGNSKFMVGATLRGRPISVVVRSSPTLAKL